MVEGTPKGTYIHTLDNKSTFFKNRPLQKS